jgi:hypothetical protein
MTATPSPKGVEPKEPEPRLVIERDEDFSLVLEALELLYAGESYTETMLAVTGKQALETIRGRLTTLTAERDEAQKERDELKAENVRLTEFMKRAHGNLAAALIAPSAKLEIDLEVAPTA